MNAPRDTGPCFYCPELPAEGDAGSLDDEEARHASASRRIRAGDSIGLIDGRGTRARAVVDAVTRRSLSFTVHERWRVPPPSPAIVVATAVPKGERFRTLIDMLSQLGAAAIVPLVCEHSTVKPRSSSVARWRRIAIEACKQSRNPHVPEIVEPSSLADSLARVGAGDALIYADAAGGRLEDCLGAGARLHLYVGPEGGFSDGEKQRLAGCGARPVGFGGNVLRVETAAVAGVVLGLLSGGAGTQ